MLERDVDVAHDVLGPPDGLDELVAPMGGVRVEQADPEVPLDLVQLAEERGERLALGGVDLAARVRTRVGPAVHAEVGGVLGDQVDLLDALGDELAGFLDDGFDRAAAVTAADAGDDAEGAGVVAAFGDLDVGRVTRREAEARGVEVRDVRRGLGQELGHAGFAAHDLMDDGDDVGDLVEADESVDLGELDAAFGALDDGEGALVALRHAAGDDELLALLAGGGLAVAHLVDGLERLVLRGVDEGAGIDDDHVGLGGVRGHGHAGLGEVADHDLGIDQVLGATQGDEAYFDGHDGIRSGDGTKCNPRPQRVSQASAGMVSGRARLVRP